MKTLYDRLKPELKEVLELQAEKYPETVEEVKNSLINNHSWSNLEIRESMDLCSLLNVVFSIDNLYDIFNDESI